MKKILALTILGALAASMAISASAVVGNPDHKDYSAVKGTPVVDGKMDEIYNSSDAIKVDLLYPDDAALAGMTATGEFRVVWDDEYLYVYAEVADTNLCEFPGDTVWQTDSFEVYFDLLNTADGSSIDYDDPSVNYVHAGQFTAAWAHRDYESGENISRQGAGVWYDSVDYTAIFDLDYDATKGYALEYQIPYTEGFTPEENMVIGVHGTINDEMDGDAVRDVVIRSQMYDGIELTHYLLTGWDNLTLAGAPAETPDEPTETPADKPEQKPTQTSDAGIVVAASVMAVAAGVILSKKR